jgi:hypothetical protein
MPGSLSGPSASDEHAAGGEVDRDFVDEVVKTVEADGDRALDLYPFLLAGPQPLEDELLDQVEQLATDVDEPDTDQELRLTAQTGLLFAARDPRRQLDRSRFRVAALRQAEVEDLDVGADRDLGGRPQTGATGAEILHGCRYLAFTRHQLETGLERDLESWMTPPFLTHERIIALQARAGHERASQWPWRYNRRVDGGKP